MEQQYYTAEEVIKLLGISKATLQRKADNGTIPYELEQGKKKGRKYPKEAIDIHVKLNQKQESPPNFTFGPSTNNDLWAGYQNTKKIYEPEDIVDYETLLEWKKANSNVFMTAKENGERAGGITIIPLEENVIVSLINEKIREQEIPSWAIRKWTDPELSVYIPSISITHTGNEQKDKQRGLFIIRNTIRWSYYLHKNYDIRKWYAIAATGEGRKLVQHLGFTKIQGIRDAYILDNFKKATEPIKAFLYTLDKIEEPLLPQEKSKRKSASKI
jgi:hypothetical protein